MTIASEIVLRALTGDLVGQTFRIGGDGGVIVGRATTCTIFVPDRRISREHAQICWQGDALVIEDLGSNNGSYVNEQKVLRQELKVGDRLRFGSTVFALEMPTSPADAHTMRVVNDPDGAAPRLVRPVERISGPVDISTLNAEDFFAAIGVGKHERLSPDSMADLVRKTRHFAILVEVSRALQQQTNLLETLPGLLDLVLQVVHGDRIALVLLDKEEKLIPKVVRSRQPGEASGPGGAGSDQTLNGPPAEELILSTTVADIVLKDRCAVITADARTDSRFLGAESVMINHVRSLAVVPMLVGNRLLGLVEVENRQSINAFDEGDLHMLSVLASMLGVALDHREVSMARERAIEELRQAQDQLLATQHRLIAAERMGMLGRMSSGIAHEVKNHLSPFMLADMIANKYPADEEIQESAQLMLEAQQRILDLVDEIREFASGERTNMEISSGDLAAVVRGVVRFVRCDRVVSNHEMSVRELHHPTVPMNAGRIRQVLINLIRNAAESYGAQDPQRRTGGIEITVDCLEDTATVSVRDFGSGIPACAQDRVFEPFFTTKGSRGLGLGLDLSRQIVRAHGGALTFETLPGTGTVFTMSLPMAPADRDEDLVDDMRTDPTGGLILPDEIQYRKP